MTEQSGIPLKIVVGGPFSSGKTEFIQAMSEIEVVKTERKIPKDDKDIKHDLTVAMDFGKITADEMAKLYLFGTPGARRFDFMWEHVLNGAMDGVIVLIDSYRIDRFEETRHILRYCADYVDVPYVIAANKQDLPDAWSAQDMQIALKLKEPVIPCCAHDVESVKHVILTLLERVLARIDEEEYEMKLARVQMCLQEREHG